MRKSNNSREVLSYRLSVVSNRERKYMKVLENCVDLENAIRNEKILIVQFGAQACAPCHAVRHKIETWCDAVQGVSSLYVPIEDFTELAAQASVFVVPTIFVYVEGKLMLRESGYFSLDAILGKVQQYIEMLKE